MACTWGASAARQASGSAADAGSVIRSQAWSGSSSAIAFSSTMRSVVRRPASAASTASQRSSWRGKRRSRRWRSSRGSLALGVRGHAARRRRRSGRRGERTPLAIRGSRAGSRPLISCGALPQRARRRAPRAAPSGVPSPERSGLDRALDASPAFKRGHALWPAVGAGRLSQAQARGAGPRTGGRERGPARAGCGAVPATPLDQGAGRARRGGGLAAARRGRAGCVLCSVLRR